MSWLGNMLSPPRQAEDVLDGGERWWGVGSGLFSGTPAAGVQVDHDSALTCATAFACTRAVAETIATLPSMVYETAPDNDRRKARENPMWRLLHDEPNPEMDTVTFFETLAMRLVNRGAAFARIERNANDHPRALWPIHNSRVTPDRDGGDLFFRVSGNRGERVIPRRDMLHLVGFGSEDGIYGRGVVPYGREEIGLDMASQQYGATWFGNGSRPAGVVRHPGFIPDKDRRDEFRRDINAIHHGRENWNKVGVLWENAEWQNIEVSPDQAQFLGTRQWQAKVLCRLWGVPPAIVQIFEDYKFATVDAMLRQFAVGTIRPLAVRIEKAIMRQLFHVRDGRGLLVPTFEEDLTFEFLLDALLRGDPKTRAETDKIMIETGQISQDDINRRDNLPTAPNGQGSKRWMPLNFAPVDEHADRQAKTRSGSSGGSEGSQESQPEFDREFLKVLKQVASNTEPQSQERPKADEFRDDDNSPQVINTESIARQWLDEAASPLFVNESQKMKAIGKQDPRQAMASMDEFYEKFEPKLCDRIRRPVELLGGNPEETAREHCNESRQRMLTAMECEEDRFQQSVADCVADWPERRIQIEDE